jgi:hypothetical protein
LRDLSMLSRGRRLILRTNTFNRIWRVFEGCVFA